MTIDDIWRSGSGIDDLYAPSSGPPWFLGGVQTPCHEPESAAGVMALPFLRTVQLLREFIGEGCRLTKQGHLFAADRKQINQMDVEDVGWDLPRHVGSYGDGWYGPNPRVDLAWTVLTKHGWLHLGDGRVCPTVKPLLADDTATGPALDGMKHLLAEAVRSAVAERPGDAVGGDLLDGLLRASGPDGLTVPLHPRDGILAHCDDTTDFLLSLIRHPHITDVPIDRRTGHVDRQGLLSLARFAADLDRLVHCGLAVVDEHDDGREEAVGYFDDYDYDYGYGYRSRRWPDTTYRVPAVFRDVVAMLRQAATPLPS